MILRFKLLRKYRKHYKIKKTRTGLFLYINRNFLTKILFYCFITISFFLSLRLAIFLHNLSFLCAFKLSHLSNCFNEIFFCIFPFLTICSSRIIFFRANLSSEFSFFFIVPCEFCRAMILASFLRPCSVSIFSTYFCCEVDKSRSKVIFLRCN